MFQSACRDVTVNASTLDPRHVVFAEVPAVRRELVNVLAPTDVLLRLLDHWLELLLVVGLVRHVRGNDDLIRSDTCLARSREARSPTFIYHLETERRPFRRPFLIQFTRESHSGLE